MIFATDVALPANVPVGTYYVLARVNAGGGIADTNPGNDVAVGSSPIMVVNVVQERDQRGRITKIHRQEIVTSGVGSSILACGGTIYIGYDDQGDVVDTSDFGDVYFPPDGSQPPDDGSNDFGPPMDNSPPPESDPGPAPDPGGGMNDGGGMDNGGGDFSSTGSDF